MSSTGQGREMRRDAMMPLYWRSVNSKDASWPHLMHHHRGRWNEMNEMSVKKWWNEICGRGQHEKPREKNLSRLHFVCHETVMEWSWCELGTPAVGFKCLNTCAMELPLDMATWRNSWQNFLLYLWYDPLSA